MPATIPHDDPSLNATYTINIPGIQDIIRIPSLEGPQLRRERWIRHRDTVSVLPRYLNWIPPILNKLDDAQDLLYTGLALLQPILGQTAILRYLPRAWLGPLGILLTINDVLNLGV